MTTVTFTRFFTDPGMRVYHPRDKASLPDGMARCLIAQGTAIFVAETQRETATRTRIKKEAR